MSQLKKCLYIIDLLRRRGPMTLNEINQSFRNSPLYEKNIEPRTFARYKDFTALNFPYYIEFNNRTKKYELFRDDPLYGEDHSLYDYLLSAYHIQSLSELAIKHQDKIVITEAPTGVENVHIILEAIDKQRGIECSYYSFTKDTVKEQTIIPYFLKTWEQRWYLVGEPANRHHKPAVYALERMDDIRLTDEIMHPSEDIAPEEYFDGSFGVNHSDDQKPETLKIKIYGSQVAYIRTLPIHDSQKEIETTPNRSIFSYYLVPTEEFYRELRACGRSVLVLSPDWLCQEFRTDAKLVYKMYNEISPE